MLEELRINERMKDPQEREAADLVMHEETKRKKGSSSVSRGPTVSPCLCCELLVLFSLSRLLLWVRNMALSSLYDDDLVFYLVRDYLIIAGVPEQFIKFDIFGNALSIAFVQDYANVDEGLDKRLSEYVKTLPIQQFCINGEIYEN